LSHYYSTGQAERKYLRGALRFVYVVLQFINLDRIIAEWALCHVFEAEIVMELELGGIN